MIISPVTSSLRTDASALSDAFTPTSLESRMLDEFAGFTVDTTFRRQAITQATQNPRNLNLESLLRLQGATDAYALDLTVGGLLTRKAVTVVETLLKS